MVPVIAVLVFTGAILLFLAALFWYGFRGEPNRDPAIGTNRPYPDGLGPTGPGAELPPYLPDFTVSEAEIFRRSADRRLTRLLPRRTKARSWMEEPGALEAAGLVDAPTVSTEPVIAPQVAPRHHPKKKHR
jgi:hypothetical protein